VAVDIALFGWHATIFFGGWVLLIAGLAVAVIATFLWKFFRRAG